MPANDPIVLDTNDNFIEEPFIDDINKFTETAYSFSFNSSINPLLANIADKKHYYDQQVEKHNTYNAQTKKGCNLLPSYEIVLNKLKIALENYQQDKPINASVNDTNVIDIRQLASKVENPQQAHNSESNIKKSSGTSETSTQGNEANSSSNESIVTYRLRLLEDLCKFMSVLSKEAVALEKTYFTTLAQNKRLSPFKEICYSNEIKKLTKLASKEFPAIDLVLFSEELSLLAFNLRNAIHSFNKGSKELTNQSEKLKKQYDDYDLRSDTSRMSHRSTMSIRSTTTASQNKSSFFQALDSSIGQLITNTLVSFSNPACAMACIKLLRSFKDEFNGTKDLQRYLAIRKIITSCIKRMALKDKGTVAEHIKDVFDESTLQGIFKNNIPTYIIEGKEELLARFLEIVGRPNAKVSLTYNDVQQIHAMWPTKSSNKSINDFTAHLMNCYEEHKSAKLITASTNGTAGTAHTTKHYGSQK